VRAGAEPDAYYVRFYGLARDGFRYTLRVAPKDVSGNDLPGKTFRVLKAKGSSSTGSIGRDGWCWRSGMGWKDEG